MKNVGSDVSYILKQYRSDVATLPACDVDSCFLPSIDWSSFLAGSSICKCPTVYIVSLLIQSCALVVLISLLYLAYAAPMQCVNFLWVQSLSMRKVINSRFCSVSGSCFAQKYFVL